MAPTYENSKPVFWFITVGKLEDWSLEKYYHEYNDVHAKMTAKVAEHVHALKDYTQLMVEYDSQTGKPVRDVEDNENWHGLTIHIWSNLEDLYVSFQDPGYKASAGKHIFCRQDQVGCLTELVAEERSSKYNQESAPKIRSIIFHRKGGRDDKKDPASVRSWLSKRLEQSKKCVHSQPDGPVLRYRQYVDCNVPSIDHFFAGTQFAGGVWQQFFAVEDFVYTGLDEASAFLAENRAWISDGAEGADKPLIITGKGLKVIGTD